MGMVIGRSKVMVWGIGCVTLMRDSGKGKWVDGGNRVCQNVLSLFVFCQLQLHRD